MIRILISILLTVTTANFSYARQFKLFHPNGNVKLIYHLKKKLLNGEYVAYYKNGRMATKGQFLNGLRNGEWIDWYHDGKLAIKREYERGYESIVEGWWQNGQTAFKGRYQNAARSGSWLFKDSLGENRLDSNAFVFSIKSDDGRNRLEWIFGSRSAEYLVENDGLEADESGLYYSFSRYMQSADDEGMEWYCSLNIRIGGLIKKGVHIENWCYLDELGYPINAFFNEKNEPLYAFYNDIGNKEALTDEYREFLTIYKFDDFERTLAEGEYDSVTAWLPGNEEFVGFQSAENKYLFHLANYNFNVKSSLTLRYDTLRKTLFLKSENLSGYDSITCEFYFHVMGSYSYPSFNLNYPIGQALYYKGGQLVYEENYVRINKQLSPSDFFVMRWYGLNDELMEQMISKRHGRLKTSNGEIFVFNKGFVIDIENEK